MKKFILFLSAIALMTSFSAAAYEQKSEPAEWAKESFNKMNELRAIPKELLSLDYSKSISRLNFARLIHSSYNAFTGVNAKTETSHKFNDMQTADKSVSAMYNLGIMQGDENNEFHPDDNISRQETAIVISNFYTALYGAPLPSGSAKNFYDNDKIANWAQGAVNAVAQAGYMGDYGDGEFHPWDNVTVEQAVSMASRMDNPGNNISDSAPADTLPELSGTLDAKCIEEDGYISVNWNTITNASEYTVSVVERRNHIRSDEIDSHSASYTTADTSMRIPSAPGRVYNITVETGNIKEDIEFVTLAVYNDISSFPIPETQEEAEPLMREIRVNVWKINASGEKYASTATLTVHQDIADNVQDIFREIFEGEEQFPIESVGAYAWRGGKSEHNWGTAIDINPTQNYCIYKSGEIVGDHWLPYEDPYSITPYGDVMNACENHGFTWGGDAWSGNIDYMHFSYFGT